MSAERQALGLRGERIAARWLRHHGWTLLAHRFRTGHRDIDLVVRQGGVVAFVEVKTRRGARFGPPAAAVGWRKRRELATGAAIWVARHGSPGLTYRFDVVGVSFFGTNVRIEYLVDAFGVENPRL